MTDLLHRPKRSRLAAVVAGAAAMMLLLAGCSGGGGEDPSASAPVSEASSSSSSAASNGSPEDTTAPSPTESGPYEPATSEGPAKNVPVPEMPDAVKEPTEEGAESAVEYWWEADHYLKTTGESSYSERVSAGDCVRCQDLIDRWTEIYELGGWAESELAKVDVQFVKMNLDGEGATGSFVVSEAPGQIYQPNGELGSTGDGTTDRPWTFSAVFDVDLGTWQIDDIGPQE